MAEVQEASRSTGVGRPLSGPLYRKLSPGPGRSAPEVASHQRARIHAAMIELVADRGYGAVTVRELGRLAGVSTRAFYEHFGDKEECFLSTYERVVRTLAQRVFASQKGSRDWGEQVQLAFGALARELADQPKTARLALVEPFAAGPAALERIRRSSAIFEAMAREGFARAPDGIAVPPLVMKGIVAGVARVACARVLAGRERELPDLADELMEWALSFRSEAASTLAGLEDRSPASAGAGLCGDGEAAAVNRQALGDERALILAATTTLAADRGYRHLSVPGIRAAAGVSRKSLAAHFEDTTDCFLAALDLLVRQAVARALRQGSMADSWPGGLHRALVAFCISVARDPSFAKLGFVELFAPGTPGLQFRARLIVAVADRLRRSAPADGQRPSEVAAEASVGAALGIIHHHIVTGRANQLPRAAPTLSFLMLAPAIGAPAAVDAIRAEHEQIGRGGAATGVAGAL